MHFSLVDVTVRIPLRVEPVAGSRMRIWQEFCEKAIPVRTPEPERLVASAVWERRVGEAFTAEHHVRHNAPGTARRGLLRVKEAGRGPRTLRSLLEVHHVVSIARAKPQFGSQIGARLKPLLHPQKHDWGITSAVADKSLDAIPVNAIWTSPITQFHILDFQRRLSAVRAPDSEKTIHGEMSPERTIQSEKTAIVDRTPF